MAKQKTNGHSQDVVLIECNIDDMSGEFFGDIMDRLFAAGALDVWFTSAYGKKNRPLYQLSALVKPENEDETLRAVFTHTSTAGVRRQTVHRVIMDRSFVHVTVAGSDIAVKRLSWKDIVKYTPEWDDCAAVSRTANRPAAEIYALAQTLAQKTDREKQNETQSF